MGLAFWEGGKLVYGTSVRHTNEDRGMVAWIAMAKAVESAIKEVWPSGRVDALAYEKMTVYADRVGFSDDLMELTGVLGAVSMIDILRDLDLDDYRAYYAGQWTGGRSKHPNHLRVIRRLQNNEMEVDALVNMLVREGEDSKGVVLEKLVGKKYIPSKSFPDDSLHVLDAIGIGLYDLRRL